MQDLSLDHVDNNRPEVDRCKGLVYRYVQERYINAKGDLFLTDRFRFLKSKSCTGCQVCDWLLEYVRELDFDPILPKGLRHGSVYELKCIAEYRDWETGIVDDVDVGFVLYEGG